MVKVDAKHKAQVYDPRRTLAGTLTPALTWGIFGLLAGGLQGLAVWAVLGAVCGGLYAYYAEHLLTKDERKRIGGRLPPSSSAIVAFVRGSDPGRLLSATASCQPATASVAAVAPDLSARVYAGATPSVESSTAAATATPTPAPDRTAALSMVTVRFADEHGAGRQAKSGSAGHQDPSAPQVELVIETNDHGRRRVIDPTAGSAAFSVPDAISWGAFGLVWGAIVGFTSNAGVLGSLERGVVTGILWTHLRSGRRRALRAVGGTRGVSAAAEGARPTPAARQLPAACLGGRAGQPAGDRAVGRARVPAPDPALQPRGARRPAGGMRTREVGGVMRQIPQNGYEVAR